MGLSTKRVKFGDIAETFGRSGKGMWVSSGRGTKRRSYFYIFWKLHDNQIKDLLRKDGINGCLKKPMEFDKLLNAITS